MKIIGAAVGNCVHVAGILSFLGLANSLGHETIFLGPATSIDKLLSEAAARKADIIAVSYRLTPSTARSIFEEIKRKIPQYRLTKCVFVFGGTPQVGKIAEEFDFFDKVFSTADQREVIDYFKGNKKRHSKGEIPAQTLIERIEENAPYPILRHHFGLSTLDETIEGIKEISESETLDVLSLAPDQNTQQFFFEQEKMKEELSGAGGVPLRSEEDFLKVYEASRRGNYPLMRCYAGTTHVVEMAKLLHKTINNAWAAIPLSWYNELDGRSERKFVNAMAENMDGIKWNAQHGIPVEINEPHQWSLRNAHDAIFVTMAYIAAYVAKNLGVETYVSQYMMNTPAGLSPKMDLAKMLATKELIHTLEDKNFHVITEVRPGLMAFPSDMDEAKGQLSFSVAQAMFLNPQIVHVVAFTEADHAAHADEIIQSLKISRRVIEESVKGLPDVSKDPEIRKRIEVLKEDSLFLIEKIRELSDSKDPLLEPQTYYSALKMGYLDTPNFVGSSIGLGKVSAVIVDGKCEAVDPKTGKVMRERERIQKLQNKAR